MLVLGWHGETHHDIFNLGAKIDPIIEQAPCNVVVLKDCGGNKVFKKALVPLAGGPNGKMALEIASILTNPDGGKVTAFTVDTGRYQFDLDEYLDEQVKLLEIPRHHFKSKTVKAKSPVLAILKEAKNYDVVVLGTTNKPLLLQMARRSLPEKIALRTTTPVVMVKSDLGVRSWIKRWI
jgi:nucleotide-binding universal stress UspA family protein